MNVVLTFLGTGQYQSCRYDINGKISHEVTYFSHALAGHLRPDKIISLQTAGARNKHGSALDDAFKTLGIPHQPVEIPDGQSESELWQIFAALTTHIEEQCELHLDITHGFRSLPVLGFIALSYLRVTRKVRIGGIHYGVWEARNQATNLAPVFDLTPFLTLLDWTAAADQFFTTGSASHLASLLSNAQQTLWRDFSGTDKSGLPRTLKSLGNSLKDASENLLLLRTKALPDSAAKLSKSLVAAQQETALYTSPFLEVLQPVNENLTRFSDTDLATLRDLVSWLADRAQTAASLTLASEWLTSYAMSICGEKNHLCGYNERAPYSLAISKLEKPDMKIAEDAAGDRCMAILDLLNKRLGEDQIKQFAATASTIRNARNDINHAGFNETPASGSALIQRAKEVAASLEEFSLPESFTTHP